MQTFQPAIKFIFITLLIDIIGFGIVIPVMPSLILSILPNNATRTVNHASQIGTWLLLSYAIMQFLFAPIIGNLSDKYGRRPVILASLMALTLDYLFLAFAHELTWLFVGRIIAGICGGNITTASAYIADISTKENRTKNFGMLGAAFGLGFIIGPILGGLIGNYGNRMPFVFAAGLTFINTIYGILILPESLRKENRRNFNWINSNPLSELKLIKNYPQLYHLFFAFFILYLAFHSVHSNWSYYNVEKFKWTPKLIGISLGVVGILISLIQGVFIGKITKILGTQKSIYFGFLFYTLGLILFALATKTWMMFTFLFVYCLGGISGPCLQAEITKQVPADQQGALQGKIASIISLTSILGPFIMNNIFIIFTQNRNSKFYFPGAPFILSAILMLINAIIIFKIFNKKSNHYIIANEH